MMTPYTVEYASVVGLKQNVLAQCVRVPYYKNAAVTCQRARKRDHVLAVGSTTFKSLTRKDGCSVCSVLTYRDGQSGR